MPHDCRIWLAWCTGKCADICVSADAGRMSAMRTYPHEDYRPERDVGQHRIAGIGQFLSDDSRHAPRADRFNNLQRQVSTHTKQRIG